MKKDWIIALQKEILLQSETALYNQKVETIYLGGGTPSILETKELEIIFEALRNQFVIDKDAEITLEANPDDIDRNKLNEWSLLGINRLSLGIQSFVEDELLWMNRAHNAETALKSLDLIAASEISNLSVDIIFGSPLLSDENLKKNLQIVTERNIPHISCYALTVEEKTSLHHAIKNKKTKDVDQEKQARQFFLVMKTLENAGYEQYEISNYAKGGMRSRHNSNYWNGSPYLGLGPSAHSFAGVNKRRWNISNNSLYIQNLYNNQLPFEEETLTFNQQMNEYVMTSIRRKEGIDLNFFKKKFGDNNFENLKIACKKINDIGYLSWDNHFIKLTKEGKLFADGIAADLFF
jgi:oxygen-independent coproporphyrinogen-3 oxidase